MNDKQRLSFDQRHLDEILDEMSSLEGSELDAFLMEIGLSPDSLLQDYEKSVEKSARARKRLRFEDARKHVHGSGFANSPKIISLDAARKREIYAEIKHRMSLSGEMTIAARNQRLDSEEDLDGFLEACIELGVIDGDGKLKV